MKSKTVPTISKTQRPVLRSTMLMSSNNDKVPPTETEVPLIAAETTPTDENEEEEEAAHLALDEIDAEGVHRSRRLQLRKEQFDALHQEMELVSYGVSETGQTRRKFPRHLSIERTKKRRLLEQQDRQRGSNLDDQAAASAPEERTSRNNRGSKAAAETHVLQASLVYGTTKPTLSDNDDDDDDDDNVSISETVDQFETVTGHEDGDAVDEFDGDLLEEDEGETEVVEELLELQEQPTTKLSKATKKRSGTKFSNPKRKKTSRLQRLRNFKSSRMAEKHGAALGAHIQGKPALAIRKLKQVAALAPSAPQIYSSLGMVYEDLLQESQRKGATVMNGPTSAKDGCMDRDIDTKTNRKNHEIPEPKSVRVSFRDNDDDDEEDDEALSAVEHRSDPRKEMEVQDKVLRQQLNFAKKAYGSYHIAAILCKRDYSLWLRAADSAYEIATLHTTIITLPDIPNNIVEYHRAEKNRWLDEAKNDYQTADHLNPPGIEIPAKLAHVMIELGMLSEALTLLTALKNRVEFVGSYRAWLLFSDLMLRIGHECNQWNSGMQTNSNYMFRRWLRKLSSTFDWKERRMQALVKALEAACGSKSCQELIGWIKNRVEQTKMHPLTVPDGIMTAPNATRDPSAMHDEEILSPDQPNECTIPLGSIDEQSTEQMLPLTASCRIVFAISSELLRHMIDMNLYDGGRLVGESVSLYLKERQAMSEIRNLKKADFDHAQQRPISLFAMQLESYDVGDDTGSDNGHDGDNDAPLSDDEDWENIDDVNLVILPLRKGTLPPEIKFLYGLCLAGEGGKAFLAAACIQALQYLPLESCSFFTVQIVDSSVNQDSSWCSFHEMRTQPLGRLTALSLASDVVRRGNKERELSIHLATLFRQQAAALTLGGLTQVVLETKGSDNAVPSHRQNRVVKVLLTAIRYELDATGNTMTSRRLEESIDSISKFLPVAWRIGSDGSIEETSVYVVDTFSRILHRYVDQTSKLGIAQDKVHMANILNHSFEIVSVLCGNANLTITDTIVRLVPDLLVLPVHSTWLSPDLEALANMAINLCIGINVSYFSGWALESFSMRLMSGSGARNFFGITTDEGPIFGYLAEFVEEELAEQWELITTRYSSKVALNFTEKLERLKNTDLYKENRQKYKAAAQNHQISVYGEDCGLAALLFFSRLCLSIEEPENDKLLVVALSILLPITQFCLRESLWDAKIGHHLIAGSNDIREWLDFSKSSDDECAVAPSNRPGYIRPSKRLLLMGADSTGEKALHEWFSWEDKQQPQSNLINVALPKLLQMWGQYPDTGNAEDRSEANKIMHEVDELMSQLRSCYTVQAVERISVQVAATLLQLVACRACRNPFLCIQQAAMFASQGPKGGMIDQLFRARLPRPDVCTTNKALLIIGRAECLNSLHFCQEAAFLCSYVATVCSLHCNGKNISEKIKQRWLVLAILTYDLSVMIRIMARSLLQDFDKREDTLGTWEVTVIDWFHRIRIENQARNDGSDNNTKVSVVSTNSAFVPFMLQASRNDDGNNKSSSVVIKEEAIDEIEELGMECGSDVETSFLVAV
jgi:hypothetical protein